MKHYLQYFNHEKMGRLPNGAEALFTTRMGVFTKLASVKDAKGSTVFVICGVGKPKAYYLWEAFTIEDVTHDGEQYTVSGPGWVLMPPQKLEGKAFDQFKASCAHFIGFRSIDDLPYHKTLKQIAEKFRGAKPGKEAEAFCDELVKLLPKDGDALFYRATLRQRLGKADAAKEDFKQAIAIGTNVRPEAEAALKATAPTAAAPAKDSLASQIVAKGRFSKGGKAAVRTDGRPFDMSEAEWDTILRRRGPEELRARLLAAYGGRCAITGFDGAAALEVAYVTGDADAGPHEPGNALLLRADIHTLFDLNLIRIHPRTRKVVVAEELKKGRYAALAARQLARSQAKEDAPTPEALQKRWDASGGDGAG
jgi:hypothetical protein